MKHTQYLFKGGSGEASYNGRTFLVLMFVDVFYRTMVSLMCVSYHGFLNVCIVQWYSIPIIYGGEFHQCASPSYSYVFILDVFRRLSINIIITLIKLLILLFLPKTALGVTFIHSNIIPL